jgi:hypothetical protein
LSVHAIITPWERVDIWRAMTSEGAPLADINPVLSERGKVGGRIVLG